VRKLSEFTFGEWAFVDGEDGETSAMMARSQRGEGQRDDRTNGKERRVKVSSYRRETSFSSPSKGGEIQCSSIYQDSAIVHVRYTVQYPV
jgi:hypothetical protein